MCANRLKSAMRLPLLSEHFHPYGEHDFGSLGGHIKIYEPQFVFNGWQRSQHCRAVFRDMHMFLDWRCTAADSGQCRCMAVIPRLAPNLRGS